MHVWLFQGPIASDWITHVIASRVAIHRASMRAAAWIASSLRFSQ
jgi:hypothetical protein